MRSTMWRRWIEEYAVREGIDINEVYIRALEAPKRETGKEQA